MQLDTEWALIAADGGHCEVAKLLRKLSPLIRELIPPPRSHSTPPTTSTALAPKGAIRLKKYPGAYENFAKGLFYSYN
jgi:hypothetical protein